MSQVPVCTPTGKIVHHLDATFAETLKGVRLVRAGGRRGPIVRVQLLPLTAHCVATAPYRKAHFLQQLDQNLPYRVWALKGVEGSR